MTALLLPILLQNFVIPVVGAVAGWVIRHVFGPGPVPRVAPAGPAPIQLVTITKEQAADAIEKDGV